jgi:hypothetical protein
MYDPAAWHAESVFGALSIALIRNLTTAAGPGDMRADA